MTLPWKSKQYQQLRHLAVNLALIQEEILMNVV